MPAQGGVSIPILDCIFAPHGQSIQSFAREYDAALYRELPNLYAVCIAQRRKDVRLIVGGFFVKTSYTRNDREFLDALSGMVHASPTLSRFIDATTSFLPARLGVTGTVPLSENEMLQIMLTQFTKHAVGGRA